LFTEQEVQEQIEKLKVMMEIKSFFRLQTPM